MRTALVLLFLLALAALQFAGNLVSVFFTEEPVRDFAAAKATRTDRLAGVDRRRCAALAQALAAAAQPVPAVLG